MKSPTEWSFYVKDLDRTDARRNYRFRRDHVLPSHGADRADSTQAPPDEAACREFERNAGDLIARYRSAKGKTKRRLGDKLRRQLVRAGFALICTQPAASPECPGSTTAADAPQATTAPAADGTARPTAEMRRRR